ncbi:hypothetical protein NliqN6_4369 [Naganishia liquefaciens]|uniref:Uncharacterized protein n=1 Tax=Naganishia liquefaciens TaxID=104408 RepID=A0A8H3TVM7_9TREE|nr:hypothetical protein NliqN6_4369 [Naganishia liquefaciens]
MSVEALSTLPAETTTSVASSISLAPDALASNTVSTDYEIASFPGSAVSDDEEKPNARWHIYSNLAHKAAMDARNRPGILPPTCPPSDDATNAAAIFNGGKCPLNSKPVRGPYRAEEGRTASVGGKLLEKKAGFGPFFLDTVPVLLDPKPKAASKNPNRGSDSTL